MVVGKETVRRCPSGDSPSPPKSMKAAWLKGTSAAEVGQRTAPSEVEGVEEKLTVAELKPQREHEEKYWGCWCGGLEVGSSQEEGWGSFHWEVEVGRVG